MSNSKLLGAAAAMIAAVVMLVGTATAAPHGPRSMYYPWVGFPFDRPGMVNPDVINGPLLSTSTYWPTVSDYGFYRPTFGYRWHHPCRRGACPFKAR